MLQLILLILSASCHHPSCFPGLQKCVFSAIYFRFLFSSIIPFSSSDIIYRLLPTCICLPTSIFSFYLFFFMSTTFFFLSRVVCLFFLFLLPFLVPFSLSFPSSAPTYLFFLFHFLRLLLSVFLPLFFPSSPQFHFLYLTYPFAISIFALIPIRSFNNFLYIFPLIQLLFCVLFFPLHNRSLFPSFILSCFSFIILRLPS